MRDAGPKLSVGQLEEEVLNQCRRIVRLYERTQGQGPRWQALCAALDALEAKVGIAESGGQLVRR